MKIRILPLLFIVISLSVGLLMYTTTRSEDILLNQWLAPFLDTTGYLFLRDLVEKVHLPQWIIYSLPDALWMLALTLVILMIWDFKLHRRSIRWIIIGLTGGFMFEILQGFQLIRGTFDINDIILMLIAGFIPISFVKLKSYSWKTN